jgi:hypothetical protein
MAYYVLARALAFLAAMLLVLSVIGGFVGLVRRRRRH